MKRTPSNLAIQKRPDVVIYREYYGISGHDQNRGGNYLE